MTRYQMKRLEMRISKKLEMKSKLQLQRIYQRLASLEKEAKSNE